MLAGLNLDAYKDLGSFCVENPEYLLEEGISYVN